MNIYAKELLERYFYSGGRDRLTPSEETIVEASEFCKIYNAIRPKRYKREFDRIIAETLQPPLEHVSAAFHKQQQKEKENSNSSKEFYQALYENMKNKFGGVLGFDPTRIGSALKSSDTEHSATFNKMKSYVMVSINNALRTGLLDSPLQGESVHKAIKDAKDTTDVVAIILGRARSPF